MLEVYPEKIAQLNAEAFANIVGTLDFGICHQARNFHLLAFAWYESL